MEKLNGQSVSGSPPPDPRHAVAEAVYTVMMDEGDPPFAELKPEDLADILTLTEQYIKAHVGWLAQQGYRLLPPGVTPIPTCTEEALAMLQAAKRFTDSKRDGKRRKTGLIGGAPKKLILPPGSGLQ